MKTDNGKKILYRVSPGNFGDDLNSDLIPSLIGGIDETIFLNVDKNYPSINQNDKIIVPIGTILNKLIPENGQKYILGSGTGYGKIPLFNNPETWHIKFVRGPQTAKLVDDTAIFNKKTHYITDAAILLKNTNTTIKTKKYEFGYMPHHGTVSNYWKNICEDLGGLYIDPRNTTEYVLREMNKCKIMVAEAMHGAIVADTLRIPWIAVKTAEKINEFKWNDWTKSMSLEYRPTFLPNIWDCPKSNIPKRVLNWRKSIVAKKGLSVLLKQQKTILSSDTIFNQKYDDILNEFKALDLELNS